jgi:phosphoglucomutase
MMTTQRFDHWYNHSAIDPQTKQQMDLMSEKERYDAFYTRVEFGTAGMRGLLGPGSNRLNIYTIRRANLGFAKYLVELAKTTDKRGVAIAYDNRFMSKEFAIESARVLAMFDIESYVYTGLRPTPQLSYTVRELNCIGGIVITASHNPKEYNGYKVYDPTGCQLIPEEIEKVIRAVEEVEDELSIEVKLTEEQEKLIHWLDEAMDIQYANRVLQIQLRPELKKDIKVVFTPQHGTAYPITDIVLKKAGYDVILVEEQCSPDPSFPNTKTPNPEEPAAYELAIEYAKKHDAQIVISTDPDADRVGVVVKHGGEYVLMTGNQTGSVLLEYVFSSMREKAIMPPKPIMFNTVVTSDLGEAVAMHHGVEVEKTLTGFKFIGEKIEKYEKSNEKQFVFGYEESYGYLIQPFVRDKDAVQACLIICEATQYYHSQGKTLFDVLQELYLRHGTYLETQTSLTLAGAQGSARIAEIMASLRKAPLKEVAGFEVIAWEDYKQSIILSGDDSFNLDFPVSDVLKMKLSDGSWIAVRPSGTEPKCKFYYCIKGDNEAETKDKFALFSQVIKKTIE